MTDHDTLCGWGNQEKVAYFLANADTLIPKRSEQLRFLVDLFLWPSVLTASISTGDCMLK